MCCEELAQFWKDDHFIKDRNNKKDPLDSFVKDKHKYLLIYANVIKLFMLFFSVFKILAL